MRAFQALRPSDSREHRDDNAPWPPFLARFRKGASQCLVLLPLLCFDARITAESLLAAVRFVRTPQRELPKRCCPLCEFILYRRRFGITGARAPLEEREHAHTHNATSLHGAGPGMEKHVRIDARGCTPSIASKSLLLSRARFARGSG